MATNVTLPSSVRRQVKEGAALQAKLAAGTLQVAPPPAAPAQQPASQPSATAQPVVAAAEDPLKVAEHRYSVLAGKYNAEINQMRGAVAALQAENAALVSRATAAPAPAPAPRVEDSFNTSVVTPKEREEYGQELIDMMARLARANGASEVAGLRAEVERLKGGVAQTQQIAVETLKDRVWSALATHVPGWEIINNSSQFLDWLEIPDIMSGVARKNGLQNAFAAGDSNRVIGIFKRFIEEDSRARSTATTTPHQAQVDPATLIAPGAPRGTGGEAPNSANGKLWSEQEIDDFYSRVQRKRINPEDQKAIEAEILAAVRDGRVIPRRDERFLANAR